MGKANYRMITSQADQFIKSTNKCIRVLAGPGTGKSFSLGQRIRHLVEDNKIKPERILVLTFTSMAVQDLKKDIRKLNVGEIEVSTLHALCLKLLASEKEQFRFLQGFEEKTMLRDLEPDFGKLGKKIEWLNQYSSKSGPEKLSDEEATFAKSLNDWLEQHRGFILNGLIPYMCRYLRENETARERLSYEHVLVDEYQDLNPDEQAFVELLTAKDGVLAVIGDDDQSIYEFKGASSQGIRAFVTAHPGCDDIRFSECRRCPSLIVEKANRLIRHNVWRIEKELTAFPENQEGSCEILSWATPEEELDGLRKRIQNANKNEDLEWDKIVVLSSTRTRGREMHEALQKAGMPATFCFRDAVFDLPENRQSFSLLSLAADPDDLISWRYLLGGEQDTRRASSYRRIRNWAKENNRGILDVLEDCVSGDLVVPYTYALVKRYGEIKEQLDGIRKEPKQLLTLCSRKGESYAEILNRVIEESESRRGQSDWLPGIRREVLDEVFSPEAAAPSDRVRIMSLHAAKGLSAPMVVVMSAVEGLVPRKGKGSVEEQRRLFYVAVTRCKAGESGAYPGKVIISAYTHSEDGEREYSPSRFIREMDEALP